ncbi:MAG: hypothetical protein DRP12_03825 [Candidatus Aenigmatarchaeota archaeon]|nr:MAG: hypothetical protein DRP12_03825 [Candidatus Aenigmarchaeota archaeon]
MDLTADSLLELMEKWNKYLEKTYNEIIRKYDLDEESKRKLKIYIFSSRTGEELVDNIKEFIQEL